MANSADATTDGETITFVVVAPDKLSKRTTVSGTFDDGSTVSADLILSRPVKSITDTDGRAYDIIKSDLNGFTATASV